MYTDKVNLQLHHRDKDGHKMSWGNQKIHEASGYQFNIDMQQADILNWDWKIQGIVGKQVTMRRVLSQKKGGSTLPLEEIPRWKKLCAEKIRLTGNQLFPTVGWTRRWIKWLKSVNVCVCEFP